MIKWVFITSLVVASLKPNLLQAQFLNLQIRVEPELSATVEQDLNFGDIITGTGPSYINLGDINMGIFNIRAYYTQNVFITLDTPTALIHQNPAILDEIPISLSIAYDNANLPSPQNATVLNNNQGFLAIHAETEFANPAQSEVWQNLELYVYGYIEVGNIADGNYSGQVILNVEYD
jgi:hypothetical protein